MTRWIQFVDTNGLNHLVTVENIVHVVSTGSDPSQPGLSGTVSDGTTFVSTVYSFNEYLELITTPTNPFIFNAGPI
jgi:hypothetical protein